jgi:uncharacterized membrane protein
MIENVLLAVHLLASAVWVGGMAFALFVLRPSLVLLAPTQRLALHTAVFARFFRLIWVIMPAALVSGWWLLFGVYGGFEGVSPVVHVMHATGIAMGAVFLVIVLGPWRALRAAQAAANPVAATAAVNRIRQLVLANLILGTLTIVAAAFA